MDITHVNYGLMLKLIRKKLGWKQAVLADYLGIERTVLSRYENGVCEFRLTPPQFVKMIELLMMCNMSLIDALDFCKQEQINLCA